jgi:hypothetical protein
MRVTPLPAALAAGAALMLGLAGCTPAPDSEQVRADTGARFVACLQGSGVEAQSDETGRVFVLLPGVTVDEVTGEMPDVADDVQFGLVGDAGSYWIAVAEAKSFADPDTQDAYAGCESDHPDFAQPAYTDPYNEAENEATRLAQVESALEFAHCGRDAGFAWVSDPDEYGGIILPSDLTEEEFRAVLAACLTPEARIGFGVDPEAPVSFDWMSVWDAATLEADR